MFQRNNAEKLLKVIYFEYQIYFYLFMKKFSTTSKQKDNITEDTEEKDCVCWWNFLEKFFYLIIHYFVNIPKMS